MAPGAKPPADDACEGSEICETGLEGAGSTEPMVGWSSEELDGRPQPEQKRASWVIEEPQLVQVGMKSVSFEFQSRKSKGNE